MLFGQDFFKIIRFAMAIIELFAKIFGDNQDRENGDNGPVVEMKVKNGKDPK